MSAIGSAPLPTARTRRSLLSSCAVASALVAAGQAMPARAANGYNATISTAPGQTLNYSGPTGANQATINLTNQNTVITFVPTDRATGGGSIDFQDRGGVTTFVGPGENSAYTVLNRVIPNDPTRSITFNGTTNSVLSDGVTRGGTLWFYSPGGIIASPTSAFNVGSLLLSANAIGINTIEDGYGRPVLQPFGDVRFSRPGGPANAAVVINPGAQLTAANYIGLIAPRVEQGGAVNARAAAYVAAEAGLLTISTDLFSIAVDTGTTEAAALTHNGTTSLSGADSRAYMVAVPKNTAITMLAGGTISYANAASVDDGAVVLSTEGVISGIANAPAPAGTQPTAIAGTANITLDNGTFTSLSAVARNAITTSNSLVFNGDVNLFGGTSVSFGAAAGATIAINRINTDGPSTLGGNLTLSSFAEGNDSSQTGGTAALFATGGGGVRIAGNALVSGDAQSFGFGATGGTATVLADSSILRVGGSLTVTANGVGSANSFGTGGTATVTTQNGQLLVGTGNDAENNSLSVTAIGFGGDSSGIGGIGTGGRASLISNGRFPAADTSVEVTGLTTIQATGFGGGSGSDQTGGTGIGGTALLSVGTALDAGGVLRRGSVVSGGAVSISGNGVGGGFAGDSGTADGGAGIGTSAQVLLAGGGLIAQSLTIDASGSGASGPDGNPFSRPGTGGNGTGGSASLIASGGGTASLGTVRIVSDGFGGAGGASLSDESGYGSAGGAGGNGRGGTAALGLSGGAFVAASGYGITIDSAGFGGAGGRSSLLAGGAGGSGTAGVQTVATTGDDPLANGGGSYLSIGSEATLDLSGASAPNVLIVAAQGTGGAGGSGIGAQGAGGSAIGGTADGRVIGGGITTASGANAAFETTAQGGSGTNGGFSNGAGGAASAGGARLAIADASLTFSTLNVRSNAAGGDGTSAGNGTGGGATLVVGNGATLDVTTFLNVSAVGFGGGPAATGDPAGVVRGGDAAGGNAQIATSGSAILRTGATAVSADARAQNSSLDTAYTGGIATAGTAGIDIGTGSAVILTDGTLSASASGGDSAFTVGGAATAGATSVGIASGGALSAQSLTLTAIARGGSASGDGGAAYDGGAATGGAATISLNGTATLAVTGATRLDVSASGGGTEAGYGRLPETLAAGGAATAGGGAGTTGGAIIDIQGGAIARLAQLSLDAIGTGGDSASGGAGGAGTGGLTRISVGSDATGGSLSVGGIALTAAGKGGDHPSGYGGIGGNGTGGTAALQVVGGTLTSTGAVLINAGGAGGAGGAEDQSGGPAGGAGGTGQGGSALLTVSDGAFNATGLSVQAQATGGAGGAGSAIDRVGAGGIGRGGGAGSADLPAGQGNGAQIVVSGTTGAIVLSGNLSVTSGGTGGAGGTDPNDTRIGAAGGGGIGGRSIVLASDGGAIRSSDPLITTIDAGAIGGTGGGDPTDGGGREAIFGGAGGNAQAGVARFTAASGGSGRFANLQLNATATGGDGAGDADGGDALAGLAEIISDDGTIAIADPSTGDQAFAFLTAFATGGAGGGSATGGNVRLNATGGGYTGKLSVNVRAQGTDGRSSSFGAGDGGSATAGTISINLASGSIDGLETTATAVAGNGGAGLAENGYGVSGSPAGGKGGDAAGGVIGIAVSNGATIRATSIDAQRYGGVGGGGRAGRDGTAGEDGQPGQQPPAAGGVNGGAGGDGGAGEAGGAGGRGGNATGSSLTLAAQTGGTLDLSAPEGNIAISLGAFAGSGGAGGNGGNGGTAGANGAQGLAGAGGAGGTGGAGIGGSLALNVSGSTFSFGNLSVSASANGSAGGAAGASGTGQPTTAGATGAAGNGTGGDISLTVSDATGDGGTLFGRITGGDLTLFTGGAGAFSGDSSTPSVGTSGRISLVSDGRFSGDRGEGAVVLGSLDITAIGAAPLGYSSDRDPLLASVDLLVRDGGVSVANGVNIYTDYHASLRTEDGGRFAIGGLLGIRAGAFVTATQAGDPAAANGITAGSVRFDANGDVITNVPILANGTGEDGRITLYGGTVTTTGLTATNAITINALNFLQASDLAVTAPANADDDSVGRIDFVAGYVPVPALVPDINLVNADMQLGGTISASRAITATAGGDIRVGGDARILSGNLLRLDAGDDVIADTGSVIRAALDPLADTSDGANDFAANAQSGLFITAGLQPLQTPLLGDLATVTVRGALSSGALDGDGLTADRTGRRGVLLQGAAVQTEGGSIAGRSLLVTIDGAPLPSADRTGGVENLANGCLAGDACLGTVDVTDALTIGALTGTANLPSSVRIAGGSQARSVSIRSQGDVSLGSQDAGGFFGGSDLLRVQSTLGTVRLANNTTLQGGGAESVTQVLGETGISAPGGTLSSGGTIGLYAGGGGIEFANLVSGGAVQTLNADTTVAQPNGITAAGDVTINRLFSVAGGDANVDAGGNVSLNRVTVSDGFGIAASGGSVLVQDASASPLGTAGTISLNATAGTASLLAGTAQGDISVSAVQRAEGGLLDAANISVLSSAGDASIDQGFARQDIQLQAAGIASANFLQAGGAITASGTSIALGNARTTGTFPETGYGAGGDITLNALDDIRITTGVDAFGTLRATSANGTVLATSLSAGNDVIVTGRTINLTSVTSRGTSAETGYGATPDGSNIRLTAIGADAGGVPAILVTSANATDDLVLQADIGSIGATQLSAGRDLTAQAAGRIDLTTAQAGRDLTLTSTGAGIAAQDLTAGGNLAATALDSITLGNAAANGAVFATNDGQITNGTVSLSAGRDASAGNYAAADITIAGTITASGAIEATAGRDVVLGTAARLRSANRVALTAGDDIVVGAGAEVRAALDPLPVTTAEGTIASPAGLLLSAGTLPLAYAPPGGNVAAIVVDGIISAAGRPISLRAGAIQAPGSVIEAGSLTIAVPDAPAAGAPQSNDNGGLTTCLQGDVCLGAVTLTGFDAGTTPVPGVLQIGSGTNPRPTNVRITGPVTAGAIDIAALNAIALGTAGGTTPIAQASGGGITLLAQAGSVDLLGNLALSAGGGALSITAGDAINGAAAQLAATGPITVAAANGVILQSTSSGGGTRIQTDAGDLSLASATTNGSTADANGNGLSLVALAGNVTLGTADLVGDLRVQAAGDAGVDAAITRIGSSGGDIAISAGGAVTAGSLTAARGITIDAGSILTTTSLVAQGNGGGDIVLTASEIDSGSLDAIGDITANAAGRLRVANARANGAIDFAANGNDLAPAPSVPNGLLAIDLGTVNAGTRLGISAPNGGIGFTSLSAPEVTLTAATRIAGGDAIARDGSIRLNAPGDVALGNATAADSIFVTAGGSIAAGSLTSGSANADATYRAIELVAGGSIDVAGTSTAYRGDVDYAADGAIQIGDAFAGDSVILASRNGGVTAGGLAAGTYPAGAQGDGEYRGAIGIDAAGDVSIGTASALTDIGLLARTGGIATGDLSAGGNAILLARGAVSTGAVTAGDRFYVAAPETLALLGDDTDPNNLDGVTPIATGGTVTLGGNVKAGSVTIAAGDALSFGTITSQGGARLSSANGAIAGAILRAAGDIDLTAADTVSISTDIATGGAISATGTGIDLSALGDLTLAAVNATAGDVSLNSGGALTVGRATATRDVLLTSGSSVASPDDARTVTATTIIAGRDATVDAQGAITVASLSAGRTGQLSGATTVSLDRGDTGLDLIVLGTTSVTGGTLTAGRDIQLVTPRAQDDQRLLPRSVTLGSGTAGDDIVLAAFGRVTAGSLTTTGTGADAGGAEYANAAGSSIGIISRQGARIGSVASAGSIDYRNTAQTGDAIATGDGNGDIVVTSQTVAGAITAANTGGSIRFGSATAGDGIDLAADGAQSFGVSADTLRAQGPITVSASGDVAIGLARSQSDVFVQSSGGAVNATELVAVDSVTARSLNDLFVRDAVATASTGTVMLGAGYTLAGSLAPAFVPGGSLNVSGTVSGGDAVTLQGGGDVTISGAARIRANRAITIASGDDIGVGNGAVIGLGPLAATGDAIASPLLAGGPTDSVTLNAGSLRTSATAGNPATIAVNGTVDGVNIALASEGLTSGSSGRVGSGSTVLANYRNGGGLTIIGGAAGGDGYAVDADTLGRTRAQTIRVNGSGDVSIRTLTLIGSGSTGGNLIGNAAAFEVATPGSVRVEGAATITSAAQSDRFAITAGDRITVLTSGGALALTDSSGALSGRLQLAARRISVATPDADAALDRLASLDARDERLGANDGVRSDAGSLQANAIEFAVRDGLYIQNSGASLASLDRRGFTVGAGGVSVTTTGSGPAEIVLNGRQATAGGGFVTGAALIPLVRLSGTGNATMASFDPRSTVNGCLIVGQSCRFDTPVIVTPPPVLTPPSQPVQDVIRSLTDGQDDLAGAINSVVQQLNSPLIEMVDFAALRLNGIIDEPVTGAGNDDFYTSFAGDDPFASATKLDEQVTGTGNDSLTAAAQKDGRCDTSQPDTDPDCK